MRRLTGLVFFLMSGWVVAEQPRHQLMLVGGGLKICSSYSTKNCQKHVQFRGEVLTGSTYAVTAERIDQIKTHWPKQGGQATPEALLALLRGVAESSQGQPMSKRKLTQWMKQSEHGRNTLDAMSDGHWGYLWDMLEVPRLQANGDALDERVVLNLSDHNSQKITAKFKQMARDVAQSKGKKKAVILVSTASASDVFDAVGFYLQLFSDKDTTVHWLPTEAALQALWADQGDCDELPKYRAKISGVHDRSRVYPHLAAHQLAFCHNPQLLDQLIKQADGLFFNGGDQSLTLRSLASVDEAGTHHSLAYEMIDQQFKSGQLVIGGSSAGAAVMGGGVLDDTPIPMVTNGASQYGLMHGAQGQVDVAKACGGELGCHDDQLTYLPSGGFTFLNFAVVDTHFSERDRPLRMSRLLADTSTPIGVGIDENTALLVSKEDGKHQFEVLGQGGVWFFHDAKSKATSGGVDLTVNLAILKTGDRVLFSGDQPKWSVNLASPSIIKHPWFKRFERASPQTMRVERSLDQLANQPRVEIEIKEEAGLWPMRMRMASLLQ